ncbi:MAG TPA: acyltransferase [Bradyrhizobium sp.]|nr:acyltransferase [Bradyrhizobium sp.]
MTLLGAVAEIWTQPWRRLRLRCLFGVKVPSDCKIGRHVTVSGRLVLGHKVTIEDGCRLTGDISIGSNAFICRQVEMTGNISIGNDCVVGSFTILSTASAGMLDVGIDTYINSFTVIGAMEAVSIGDHCIFAAYVAITDATHGIDDLSIATKHAPIAAKPVRIGNNVWLGSGVMIMMGSHVGDHAVVGARSLVRGDLPDRSVSFGTPAKVHRLRQ